MYVLLPVAIGSLLASIITTMIVETFLSKSISILGSLIIFERTTNSGIAFGIQPPQFLLFILIPCVLILLSVMAWRVRHQHIPSIGFGLILGGAFGNIIDRIGDSVVTDFIRIGWWPSFNIADSCITVGVVILLLFGEWK